MQHFPRQITSFTGILLRSAKKELYPFSDEVPKAQEWLSDGPESNSKEMRAMGTEPYTLSQPSVIKNKTDSTSV